MHDLIITTDGSGTARGAPGGWACILRCNDERTELAGGAEDTSNNLMELEAVYQGLLAAPHDGAQVQVRTDSQCVIGWLTGTFAARNVHIHAAVTRIQAVTLRRAFVLSFEFVRGHTGDPDNELCDALAGAERRKRLSVR